MTVDDLFDRAAEIDVDEACPAIGVELGRLGLINLRPADDKCRAAADDLYAKLRGAGIEVLYDDREESPGAKFAAMDLIGLPDQLILGPRGLAAGTVELKSRKTGERQELSADAALAKLAG